MTEKILLVDDEPAVLAGYQRSLHREFEVDTAVGGEIGLKTMRERGPYAIVISDMRMPGMSGSQFLAMAKEAAPDTVRMLLTGFTEIESAIAAVNDGNIYRFLTKPCAKEILVGAIHAGISQYRLIRSEKELLEKTLLGSIKVLADVLNAASPEAFHRSLRIVEFVRQISSNFKLQSAWRVEAAATLSQLGLVTVDPDILQRAFVGMKLSLEDQAHFNAHPAAAKRLLAGIPRLEPVAWMIGQQLITHIPTEIPELPADIWSETVLGAKILKLAVAFDDLRLKPLSDEQSLHRLRFRSAEFGKELLEAMVGVSLQHVNMERRRVSIPNLATGMILDQEICLKEGMLLVPKGQHITTTLLIKLENYAHAGMIGREVTALVPM